MATLTKWRLQDFVFESIIKISEDHAGIFLVRSGGTPYVLKVFYPLPRGIIWPPDEEPDLFKREYGAYLKMLPAGLCDKGIIPRFMGTLEDIDPREALPFLASFANEVDPINAILIEYVPDIKMFDFTNYTPERGARFYEALEEIHRSGVIHCDAEPRAMMVQESTDRILWIDFDCAQSFVPGQIPSVWQEYFEEELVVLRLFLDAVAVDAKNGEMKESTSWYFSFE